MTMNTSIDIQLCHTLVIIMKKDSTTISGWLDISLLPTFTSIPKYICWKSSKNMVLKKACFHKVYSISNARKLMTRNTSIGIQFCHTLDIIMKKDYITISRWFDLSVIHTLTLLLDFICYNWGQNMVSKRHPFIGYTS